MLKKRIVAAVVVKDGWTVQSIGFSRWLPVGKPEIVVEYFDRYGADEILLLDISAAGGEQGPNFDLVRRVADHCRVPLTYGGGIRSVHDIERLLLLGADKVSICSGFHDQPDLIGEGARFFGKQCIVACLDVVKDAAAIACRSHGGRCVTGIDLFAAALLAQRVGAGEVLIQSVDRDGSKVGYDLDSAERLAALLGIPLIIMGGAGCPRHFREALAIPGVMAAAAANYFHYTEHSVNVLKSYLLRNGIDVRLETHADYRKTLLDSIGRPARKTDEELLYSRFEHAEEEMI